MSDFSTIGKPMAMVDAAGKTTGTGKYTDDLMLPGMLCGKILHSPHPHAYVRNVDASRALALEGVVAVVTGKDAPITYGILPIGHDEHALAVDKVRYVGDNVACVVAVSEAIAERALELINVDYELLPSWFDPEESMRAEGEFIHEQRAHNIEKEYHHSFGNPELGFAEADYVTVPLEPEESGEDLAPADTERFVAELEERMRDAARKFEFETAAGLRDRIKRLKAKAIA